VRVRSVALMFSNGRVRFTGHQVVQAAIGPRIRCDHVLCFVHIKEGLGDTTCRGKRVEPPGSGILREPIRAMSIDPMHRWAHETLEYAPILALGNRNPTGTSLEVCFYVSERANRKRTCSNACPQEPQCSVKKWVCGIGNPAWREMLVGHP
jgi:hypothetical protein